MMSFWARLMGINARKVMWYVLPICQVILLFCLWRVAQTYTGYPMVDIPVLATEPYSVTNRFPTLWQANRKPMPPIENPFTSLYMQSLLQELRRAELELAAKASADAAEQARSAVLQAATAAAAGSTNQTTTAAPLPLVEPVQTARLLLTYRGMIVRPDGTRLALIESGKEQAATFFTAGSLIAGHTLRDIERQGASLVETPGRSIALKLGETLEVEIR